MTVLAETLRLVAQNIATVVEGIGVLIVAVAVVLATVRFVTGLVARRRTLPSDSVRLPSAARWRFRWSSCSAPTSCAPRSSQAGMRSGAWPPSPPSAPRSTIFLQREIQPRRPPKGCGLRTIRRRCARPCNPLESAETTSVWLFLFFVGH
jgi:hypothetical protein